MKDIRDTLLTYHLLGMLVSMWHNEPLAVVAVILGAILLVRRWQ